jgi:hypothetical protein
MFTSAAHSVKTIGQISALTVAGQRVNSALGVDSSLSAGCLVGAPMCCYDGIDRNEDQERNRLRKEQTDWYGGDQPKDRQPLMKDC